LSKHIAAALFLVLAAGCESRRVRPVVAHERTVTVVVRARPGARVEIGRAGTRGAMVEPGRRGDASTGGLFVVPALPRGDFRVAASASGRARAVRWITTWPGITDVALDLPPEAPVSGRVLLGDKPIAGATVTAVQDGETFEATAGPDGRYRLEGLSAGPISLGVRASGFAPSEREALAPTEGLDVTLRRLVRLQGTVKTGKGQPLAGTAVHVGGSGLWPPRAIQADDSGRYEIDVVEGVYELRAEAPGMVSELVEGVDVVAPGARQDLTLVPAAPLKGSVRSQDGKPVAGAVVRLGAAALGALGRRALSDASGAFQLGPLPEGAYRVEVAAAGFLPATLGPVTVRPPKPGWVHATLSRGASVSGKVVDTRGFGLAGARIQVRIVGEDGLPRIHSQEVAESAARFLIARGELGVTQGRVPFPSESVSAGRAFQTDQEGGFAISGLPSGKATVSATHPDFAEGQSAVIALSEGAVAEARLVLRRGAQVSGRIVDEAGYPLAQALVRVRQGAGPSRTTVSDVHGDYLLAGAQGRARIEAELEGYLPASRRVRLEDDERLDRIDLTMEPARLRIEGRVSDEGGIPVEGAAVRVEPTRGPKRKTQTDAKGLFRVEALGPGPTRLEITHQDYWPLRTTVLPEREEDVELVLPFGGGIEGYVRDAQTHEPVAEFSARCGTVSVKGAEGAFTLQPLPAGPCTLEVLSPGYRPARKRVQVPAGDRPREVTVRNLLVEVDLE